MTWSNFTSNFLSWVKITVFNCFPSSITYLGEVSLFRDAGSNLLFHLLHLRLLTQGIPTVSSKWIKSISVKYWSGSADTISVSETNTTIWVYKCTMIKRDIMVAWGWQDLTTHIKNSRVKMKVSLPQSKQQAISST